MIAIENVALLDFLGCEAVHNFQEKIVAILNSMVDMKHNVPVKGPMHIQGKL